MEVNKILLNRKAQLSLINIIFFVILVAMAAVTTPIISDFLSSAVNNTNLSSTSVLIINSIVPVFWLGVIITFFLYVAPLRPQQY